MEWVTIDGSYGEGGGQILRSSLALSALTGKPLHIVNIRAGRKNPGLRPQHLTAVRAAAAVSDAEVQGAKVNSPELRFVPHRLKGGTFTFDVSVDQPSAGSGTLVFQTVFPALSFAPHPSTVRIIRCGTHVPFSPPYDYLAAEVFAEIGLTIRHQSPLPHTVPLGYTNGCIGYLPTATAYEEGGYEVEQAFKFYGRLLMHAPESEQIATEWLLRQLKQVAAAPPS